MSVFFYELSNHVREPASHVMFNSGLSKAEISFLLRRELQRTRHSSVFALPGLVFDSGQANWLGIN